MKTQLTVVAIKQIVIVTCPLKEQADNLIQDHGILREAIKDYAIKLEKLDIEIFDTYKNRIATSNGFYLAFFDDAVEKV